MFVVRFYIEIFLISGSKVITMAKMEIIKLWFIRKFLLVTWVERKSGFIIDVVMEL